MDEILRYRYVVLFAIYRTNNFVLHQLKREIADRIQDSGLRPDGALILLTLFDQMIVSPYHESLDHHDDFPLPQKFRDMDDERFLERCRGSLEKIMKNAERDKDGISSHSILKSINQSWEYLADVFFWG